MSYAQKDTTILNFTGNEKLKFEISQLDYHRKHVELALKQAEYHLKKSQELASLIQGANKYFKSGGEHV